MGVDGGGAPPAMSEQPSDGGKADAVDDALRSSGVPTVVDAKSGQSGLLANFAPEAVQQAGGQSFGNIRTACSSRGSRATSRAASGPSQIVRGPVLESANRALEPLSVISPIPSHRRWRISERRAGQREQPDGGDRPGTVLLVPVKYGAQAIEFFTVEIPRHGLSLVLDDVGAGVGDRFSEFTPLARGIEHRPQDLEGPVGRAGLSPRHVGHRRAISAVTAPIVAYSPAMLRGGGTMGALGNLGLTARLSSRSCSCWAWRANS